MASLNLRNRYAGEVSTGFLMSVGCPEFWHHYSGDNVLLTYTGVWVYVT